MFDQFSRSYLRPNLIHDFLQFACICLFRIQTDFMVFAKLSTRIFPIYLHLDALIKIVIVQCMQVSPDNSVISVKTLCLFISLPVYTIS